MTIFLAVAGPLTALLIERQRSRLAQLVQEKNNLIDRYATEKQHDDGTINDLTGKLDLWEGRANPWEFWPPNARRTAASKVARRPVRARRVPWQTVGGTRAPTTRSWHAAAGLGDHGGRIGQYG